MLNGNRYRSWNSSFSLSMSNRKCMSTKCVRIHKGIKSHIYVASMDMNSSNRRLPKMSIKPSKALLKTFEDECNHTCARYRYWWSTKTSKMPYASHKFEQCVQDCIRKTVENEKAAALRTYDCHRNK